jgi:hypothetical protein
VKIGCILLDETNSGWMAKYKVVLDYKLEHMNKVLDEQLTCRRRAPGCLNRGEAGRPGPAGLGGFLPLLASVFFQHTHLCFVTFVAACSTGCTAQTLSYTPLLALLVIPIDFFALSHVYAPLSHMPP